MGLYILCCYGSSYYRVNVLFNEGITMYWAILIILILVGVFDLYLYFTGKKTLSQGYGLDRLGITKAPPKWALRTIMCVTLGLSWWLFGGVETFVKVLIGVIIGHILWQD